MPSSHVCSQYHVPLKKENCNHIIPVFTAHVAMSTMLLTEHSQPEPPLRKLIPPTLATISP